MRVIVTGAGRGIGCGISRVLARHGHDVGLLARSRSELDELRAELVEKGGSAIAAPCDVRSFEETRAAVDLVVGEWGGVDALINNAGIVLRKDALAISLDEWRAVLETNVSGVFHACRAVLPHLIPRGSGHIINISSISGRLPLAGGSAYAASKHAVTGFSESLLLEVREHGIKVTTIFPGSVEVEASHPEDADWKLLPEEVGEACRHVLETSSRNCISRVEMRPLRPPRAPS